MKKSKDVVTKSCSSSLVFWYNKTEKTVSKGCADRTEILIKHDKTTKKNTLTDKKGKDLKRQNEKKITSFNKFGQAGTSLNKFGNLDKFGEVLTSLNKKLKGLNRLGEFSTSLNKHGQIMKSLNIFGQFWTILNKFWQVCTNLYKFEQF